ncbi:hypothetical protein VNO77_39360 [Canavalia gladiata]|uniref:Ribosome-recycling factor, chloroplastic n=1 Tax=Canavalia gladiata TaxID=3824 RepID=A0AAN9PZP8_CANGL
MLFITNNIILHCNCCRRALFFYTNIVYSAPSRKCYGGIKWTWRLHHCAFLGGAVATFSDREAVASLHHSIVVCSWYCSFVMAVSLWRGRNASSALNLFTNTVRRFSSGIFIALLTQQLQHLNEFHSILEAMQGTLLLSSESDHQLIGRNQNKSQTSVNVMMYGYVRRAFLYRNMFRLRTSGVVHACDVSPVKICMSESNRVFTLLTTPNFMAESRRAFAKGRKSKDEGDVNTIEVPPNIGPTVKANAISQMEAAMAALSAELNKLRTGRASPGMLDHIIVETSGVKIPLNRVALVSVIDPKTLSVSPYDPQTLKQLENAIVSSPLGLNPKSDGERLIAVIPPLTKEHMQAMTKLVAKSCEDARQSIRRARQKAMDVIKKLYSSLPKDDIKRLEKEVDDLTKKFIKTAEDVCKAKEKEISQG